MKLEKVVMYLLIVMWIIVGAVNALNPSAVGIILFTVMIVGLLYFLISCSDLLDEYSELCDGWSLICKINNAKIKLLESKLNRRKKT